MSKYTTDVRSICESFAGYRESKGYVSIEKVIEKSREKVFDFNYPIFDENYRTVLETKILKRYYMNEICEETVGLWKLRLDTKMNEIMPYYNQLYESQLLTFNPLYDTHTIREHQGKSTGNKDSVNDNRDKVTDEITSEFKEHNTNKSDGTSKVISKDETITDEHTKTDNKVVDWKKQSDTPQGGLSGIENDTYLSMAIKVTNDLNGEVTTLNSDTTNANSNTVIENTDTLNKIGDKTDSRKSERTNVGTYNENIKNTESYLESVVGKTGGTSYSKLLMEFRETFINIDVQILDELDNLFFNLW